MNDSLLEANTGSLFEKLWGPYNEELFNQSVELFQRRLQIHGFDSSWFKGKKVLDAGCGGGRNTIAMATLGATQANGIDLGKAGIADATRRAQQRGLNQCSFKYASIHDIPLADESLDMVWCAGVLMITADEERALNELARVTKKGGYLYLLVYATEGMRWPLINVLRPLAECIGQPSVEEAMKQAQMPANKIRTFLDDLFCPKLDFYTWERMERMLKARGFTNIDRWGVDERLDHEANLAAYREDLESLATLFAAGKSDEFNSCRELYRCGYQAVESAIESIRWFESEVQAGNISERRAMDIVIGQGHHRVLATKG
jgi:ubiquinone/menaquinone biosynthesis C-methylase UbiE